MGRHGSPRAHTSGKRSHVVQGQGHFKVGPRVPNLFTICENINLPFQAGNNEVLQTMRRGYTNEEYRSLIDKIRNKIPNVSLTTDLIVGFCGETDEQFQDSLNLIKDIKFDKVHSAAYSTRTGIIADRKMVDDVPPEVKKDRLIQINESQEKILKTLKILKAVWGLEQKERSFLNPWVIRRTLVCSVVSGHDINIEF